MSNKAIKTSDNIIILVTIVLLVAAAVTYFLPDKAQNLGNAEAPLPNATTTNASTTVGTGIVTIFNENTAAVRRTISNTGTGTLYLWTKSTSTGFTSASGEAVFTLTKLEMSEATGNLWKGKIFGTMSNGSSTITYSEW